jgi:hypothetical protein
MHVVQDVFAQLLVEPLYNGCTVYAQALLVAHVWSNACCLATQRMLLPLQSNT